MPPLLTTGTSEEMHWEQLPYPIYSYLFGPLKEALGQKSSRANDKVKVFVQ
jgi:hypothetical protein